MMHQNLISQKTKLKIYLLLTILFMSFTLNAKTLDEVRSAFLFQMSKFIEFPLPAPKDINFCFFTKDQGPGKILNGRANLVSRNRKINVIILNKKVKYSELNDICNIIYFNKSMETSINKTDLNIFNANIAIVGESVEFLEHGGMTALVQQGNKIRLYINKPVLSGSDIKIASRLLSLAKFHPE